jgi:predicted nucleotidyltransferase
MTVSAITSVVDPRILRIAAAIRAEIPYSDVRLFGSRARGQGRPDSDADLLIIVPDAWLAQHKRLSVLGRLRLSPPIGWPASIWSKTFCGRWRSLGLGFEFNPPPGMIKG